MAEENALVIIEVAVHDTERYRAYMAAGTRSVELYGGRFLVRGGDPGSLEGNWNAPRVAVVAFKDRRTAEAWYHSKEYQAAKALRDGAAEFKAIVVGGIQHELPRDGTSAQANGTSPSGAEGMLARLGVAVPEAPVPIGLFQPVVLSGNLAFVSGHVAAGDPDTRIRGVLGRDVSIDEGATNARAAVVAALSSLRGALGSLNRVKRIINARFYVASTADFSEHPKVANGGSELLLSIFGDNGGHARAAVGVSSLPLNSPVEVELVVEVR